MASSSGQVTAQHQSQGPLKIKVSTRIMWNDIPSVILSIVTGGQSSARDTANNIVAGARQRAPVSAHGSNGNLPGFMRDSIHAVTARPRGYRVFVDAYYGAFVEYGTRRNRAQPFLRPAVEAVKQSFINDVARNVTSFTHR